MSDPIKDLKMEERLRRIFQNPQLQATVVDTVVGNKPIGWSRKSNSPYYKKEYAERLKAEVDKMMVDRKDICYFYDDFLEKFGISKDTLYLQVNQAKRYLIERMDDADRTYLKFFETVRITRERGIGVAIRFIPELRNGLADYTPRSIIPKEEEPKWKQEINEFLDNPDNTGETLLIDKLALTPDEIKDLKISLVQLKNVISSISSHTVKLVKINL